MYTVSNFVEMYIMLSIIKIGSNIICYLFDYEIVIECLNVSIRLASSQFG